MVRVRSFTLAGVTAWFPSGDHGPPHFHATRAGEWHYRVFFLNAPANMLEPKWEKKMMRPSQRKVLLRAVVGHRFELLTEWTEVASQ